MSVDPDAQSIKDRKNLSANGYLEVTLMITSKGNIHSNPVLSFRGLPIDDKEEFVYGLEDEIEKTSRTFKIGSRQQEHNLIDALKLLAESSQKKKLEKNLSRILT